MLKPKGKDKPGPTCWLFLGDSQNIGGYAATYDAMKEALEERYTNASIYADPQGETQLYYQDSDPELAFDCGCVTQDYGWRNPHGVLLHSRSKQIRRGQFCKNMSSTGQDILHLGSMERAQRLIEHPPLRDGGVTVTGQWLAQASGSAPPAPPPAPNPPGGYTFKG